jgi:hypothetical protein
MLAGWCAGPDHQLSVRAGRPDKSISGADPPVARFERWSDGKREIASRMIRKAIGADDPRQVRSVLPSHRPYGPDGRMIRLLGS